MNRRSFLTLLTAAPLAGFAAVKVLAETEKLHDGMYDGRFWCFRVIKPQKVYYSEISDRAYYGRTICSCPVCLKIQNQRNLYWRQQARRMIRQALEREFPGLPDTVGYYGRYPAVQNGE